VELLRAREIGVFLPPEAPLRELAEKIQEIGRQRIVVSGARRREQVEELLRGALEATFDAPEAERVAEWLEETAWLLGQTGREEEARACVAAAAEVRGPRRAESEALRAVLEGTLAPVLAQVGEEEREQEASSLVVKP
jgi:hypothetical protein